MNSKIISLHEMMRKTAREMQSFIFAFTAMKIKKTSTTSMTQSILQGQDNIHVT